MDIASLRRELEDHLKHNPHEQAPEGFRDRFEHWAEAYEAEQDEEAKAELAELLRRVPAEAEAAAKCGTDEPDAPGAAPPADAAPRPEPEAPATRPAPAPEPAGDAPRIPDAGEPGSGRWLIIAAILLALAAAAYFAFAR